MTVSLRAATEAAEDVTDPMAVVEEERPALTLVVRPARGTEKQCADAANDFLRASKTRSNDRGIVHPYCSPAQLIEAVQKEVSCRREGRIRVEFHDDAASESEPVAFLLHDDLPVIVEELDRLFAECETALTRVPDGWAYDITKPPIRETEDDDEGSGDDDEGSGDGGRDEKPARLVGSYGSVIHLEASWTLRGLKYGTSFPVLSSASCCCGSCGVEDTTTVRAEVVDGEVRITSEEDGYTTIVHLPVPPNADLATLEAWTGEAVVEHVDAAKHRNMSRSLVDAVSAGDVERVKSAVSALRAWASGRPGGLDRPGWCLGAFSDVQGRAQLLGGEVWRAIFEGMDPDRGSVLRAARWFGGCVHVPWSWLNGGEWTAVDPRRKPSDESVCAVRSELAAKYRLADAVPNAASSVRVAGLKAPEYKNLKYLIDNPLPAMT